MGTWDIRLAYEPAAANTDGALYFRPAPVVASPVFSSHGTRVAGQMDSDKRQMDSDIAQSVLFSVGTCTSKCAATHESEFVPLSAASLCLHDAAHSESDSSSMPDMVSIGSEGSANDFPICAKNLAAAVDLAQPSREYPTFEHSLPLSGATARDLVAEIAACGLRDSAPVPRHRPVGIERELCALMTKLEGSS